MSRICRLRNEITCEEALYFAPERIRLVQEDIIALLRVVRCDKCDDIKDILCTIEDNLYKLEELLKYIKDCSEYMDFQCSPYRVYSQILESISLVEGASGLVYYAIKYGDCQDYCKVIGLLHEALRLVGIAFRFMQNAEREYIS